MQNKTIKRAVVPAYGGHGDVDQRRLDLLKQQEKLEQDQAQLEGQLKNINKKVQLIQPRLPPPLAAQWSENSPNSARKMPAPASDWIIY